MRINKTINNQKGSVVLEGLIAILIFSFGLLGIAAFQLNMVKQTTGVQYRMQTSLLINSAIGEIEADAKQLGCYTGGVCPNSTNSTKFFADIAKLPGAATNPPVITTNNGVTTFIVSWVIQNEKDFAGNAVIHSMKSQTATLIIN